MYSKLFTGIDWVRQQPLSTRLWVSAAFASMSVFAWFMGRIWPWGLLIAVLPLVLGKRSSVDDEFFREAKETGEAALVMVRREVSLAELEPLLARLSSATTSGFGPDQMKAVLYGAREPGPGGEKRFQYVVMFAARPTSLQLTLRKAGPAQLELAALGEAALVAHLKPA